MQRAAWDSSSSRNTNMHLKQDDGGEGHNVMIGEQIGSNKTSDSRPAPSKTQERV